MNPLLQSPSFAIFICTTICLSAPISGHGHLDESPSPIGEAWTGNGQHRYTARADWAHFEDGGDVGSTHGGIAIDREGNLYISTDGPRGICVFSPDGTLLKTFAPGYAGTHALTLREEDGREVLYGAHLKGQRIFKLDLDGNLLLEIKDTPEAPIPGSFKGLTAIAVGPDGRIYAGVGYGSNRIHIFDVEGTLIKSFNEKGAQLDQTHTCHGMAIDTRYAEPRLLVADRENHRLKHYDLDGNLISIYATHLRRPCAMSIWGDYCAVAELQGRVTILDKNGTPVAFLGDNPNEAQWAAFETALDDIPPGIFTAPHGLSYDAKGNLYVQDWNQTGRISQLKKVEF